MYKQKIGLFVISISIIFSISCSTKNKNLAELTEIATSVNLWTGVAVSSEGRIFVNYPRWEKEHSISVAEIFLNGKSRAYPNLLLNLWDSTKNQSDYFVCVQSVYVDNEDNLWVLDAANPMFKGIYLNGPKLIKIDLQSNKIVQKIIFDTTAVHGLSYLNDVRIDNSLGYAYISDSGMGSIIIVNLETGKYHKALYNHYSTKLEQTIITIEERQMDIQVNVDGIALDKTAEYLYYQALTGRKLYRIACNLLRDTAMTEQQLGDYVEFVAEVGVSDGIAFGMDGNLYLTSLEQNAITRYTSAGKIENVVKSNLLKWPDSFSVTKDGTIYVTTSQIHLRGNIVEPFRIFKIELKESS